MATPKLQIIIGADISKAERELKRLSSRIKGMAKDLQGFGASMTRMTAPLAGWGTGAVAASLKIQAAMKTIRAGTGAAGDALKGLKADFEAVGRQTSVPLDKVAATIADLNTYLGQTGKPLRNMALSVSEAARMAGEDSKTLGVAVAQAMNNMGVAAADGVGFMDKLFQASQSTGVGMTELAEKISRMGASMRAAGFSAEESMALFASFNKAGVNTEQVVGGIRKAMAKMAEVGVNDIPGALRRAVESIKNTASASEATKKSMALFGQKAGPDMAVLIREGKLSIGELTDQLLKSSGLIAQTAKDTDGAAEKWNRAKNAMTLTAQLLGDSLLSLGEDYVLPAIDWFNKLTPSANRAVAALGACVVALGPLSYLAGSIMSAGGGMIGFLRGGYLALKNLAMVTLSTKGAMLLLARDMGLTGRAAAVTAASMVNACGTADKLRMAMTGLGGVLTGPTGLLLALGAVAAYLAYDYISSSRKAQAETETFKAEIDKLAQSVASLSDMEIDINIDKAEKRIAELQQKIEANSKNYNLLKSAGGEWDAVASTDMHELESEKENLTRQLEAQTKFKAIYQGETTYRDYRPKILAQQAAFTDALGKTKSSNEARKLASTYVESINKLIGEIDPESKVARYAKSIQSQINSAATTFRPRGTGSPFIRTKTIDDMTERLRWQNANGFLNDDDYLKILRSRLAVQTGGKGAGAWNKDARSTYDELQRLMKDSSAKSNEALRWQNSAGFLSNADYADKLQSRLTGLTGGMSDVAKWGDQARATFDELQRVIGEQVAPAMDTLKDRFASGQITSGEYQAQLQALMEQYAQFPGVTDKIRAAMDGAKEKTLSFAESMKAAIDDAKDAVDDLSVTMSTGLADSFARAVAYGENLGDSLKKLGQDIIYTVMKMWMLQSVTRMFGGLFGGGGGGGGTPSIPLAGWVASGTTAAKGRAFNLGGSLIPFADGGIVKSPTLFKFSSGTGLMGEAGPEAIMPLRRDSRGRLGVSTEGNAPGGVYAPQFNITVYNEGAGNMSDEQAKVFGENFRDAVDARVMENMGKFQRMGYFRNSYA